MNKQIPKLERDLLLAHFSKLSSEERWNLLTRIRVIQNRPVADKNKTGFDGIQAEKIRKNLGLTRRALCLRLDSDLEEITLYKYERCQLRVNPGKEKTKKYLEWLKEHGFRNKKALLSQ